jgi:hypothetical protein
MSKKFEVKKRVTRSLNRLVEAHPNKEKEGESRKEVIEIDGRDCR